MDQGMWQAFINQVNGSGGILGRKIVPFFQQVDVADTSAQQAACTTWTQTDHVFMVIDGNTLQGAGQLCVTAQNHTIDLGGSEAYSTTEEYQQAGGLLISQAANATRVFADWANALQSLGKLQGRTIGLVVDEGDADTAANEGLVPVLSKLGDKIAYTAVISNDPSQGPTEAVDAVPQMQSAGVNLVLDATTFVNAASFVQQANSIGWKPQYSVNSWDGNDVGEFLGSMPSSFDGAIAITYYPLSTPPDPEQPVAQTCINEYDQQSGTSFQPSSSNWITQGEMTIFCQDINLLATAGRLAGPDLTKAHFIAAVEGLGSSFNFGGLGGSFGPGKTDWADDVRAAVWGPANGTSINCAANGGGSCWNDDGPAFNPEG
jgi:ABC-type branched-subunit amino acid transport system substrate-binding protein